MTDTGRSSANGRGQTAEGPGWVARLAERLAGNEDRLCEPVLARLQASGRLPDSGRLDPAAVLAAVVELAAGPALLLTRRGDDLPQHGGQVAFPGGAQDPGDTGPEDTALREAQEEVGLARERVRVIGRLPRYPTVTGYLVTPVVGYVAEPRRFVPQPSEVAAIFTVPLPVLLERSRWEDRPLEFAGQRFANRELDWEGHRIWGATAGMLQLLLGPLREAMEAGA